MTTYLSTVEPIFWRDGHLVLMDQRRLPHEVSYLDCKSCRDVAEAIKEMVVRGAPAIGISAAYGVVLAARESYARYGNGWQAPFEELLQELAAARPTAVNLMWAIDAMTNDLSNSGEDPEPALIAKARELHHADLRINQTMGDLGAELLEANSRVITHCNAGALATAGYGTALGVIRSAYRDKRLVEVFACETRPWLQGARLTAWELQQDNIPVTVMADHAAAQLMANAEREDEKITWVITGADRVAANGDVANKIGTYALAIAARYHHVKMMVVAPTSTIDLNTATGADIPIEQRAGAEILQLQGVQIAAQNVAALNPVFDVTPAELIDVLVTEKGVLKCPDREQITGLFNN